MMNHFVSVCVVERVWFMGVVLFVVVVVDCVLSQLTERVTWSWQQR